MKKNKKAKELADVVAKDFVIFKAGHWNNETFTEDDLDNMVKSFNTAEPIPIIVGHSSDYKGRTLIPAFGRIMGGLKRVGKDLIACGAEFNDKLAEWIKNGFYNQRSIELTKDNKKVLAVGMLGAVPPAVKGLPGNDQALADVALQFSAMNEAKVIEFQEADLAPEDSSSPLDETESLGVEDTIKNLSEYCGRFLEDVSVMLENGEEPERVMEEVWELQRDLCEALNLHSQFIKKIEQIEEKQEGEMSEKLPGWKQFTETIKKLFTNKEKEMDAKKEKEFTDKITELENTVKEFQDKETANAEAIAKAEKEQKEADTKAADELKAAEVKVFCDTAIKENRMTPAMREVDEPIMIDFAKTNADALKSFQQKYTGQVVPLGVVKEIDQTASHNQNPQVMQDAEKYAVAHAKEKEFAGLDKDQATKRAFFLYRQGLIKFEGK